MSSVTIAVLIASKIAENTQAEQYVSPTTGNGVNTIIDKFTATNVTALVATLSVNLITTGDSAGNQNLITKNYSIAAGTSYLFPEIVGHVLAPGDSISTIAGTANAITIRSSGRQVT